MVSKGAEWADGVTGRLGDRVVPFREDRSESEVEFIDSES